MERGKMSDGTPFVAIGADEPEAERLMVWDRCPECGTRRDFNFWDLYACKPIVCPECGHVSVAKKERL